MASRDATGEHRRRHERAVNALAGSATSGRSPGSTVCRHPDDPAALSREELRQLKDIAWGTGALLVGGGTIGVMVLLSVSAGTSLGIEGFSGLELLGLAPLTASSPPASTPASWRR